jgi:Trypsin
MRKRLLVGAVLALLVLALCVAAPAFAITQGQPDGSGHPNVCAIVAEDQGQLFVIGSGTLIAPRVVLTASHVTAYIQTFSNDVYVSFAPVFDAAVGTQGLPHGTMYTNPGFSQRQNDPDDVAVVLLDEAQPMEPAALPPAGLLGQLAAKDGLRGSTYTCVGYGSLPPITGGGRPQFTGAGTRRVSVSSFLALTPAWLFLSQNAATGNGGTGFGDSGGPIFIGRSGTLAGVTVKGDAMLRSTNIVYRLDTAPPRAFLAQFAPYGVILP